MHKSRLTIITNNLYTFGGGEKLALDIAIGMKRHFEVTILNPVSDKDTAVIDRKSVERQFDLSGVRIVDVKSAGIKTKAAFVNEPVVLKVLGPRAFARFAGEIRKADIVYVMSHNPPIFLVSSFFSRLFGKKLVLGIHNFSIAKVLQSKNTLGERLARRNLMLLLGGIRYFHVTSKRDFDLIHSLFPKARVSLIPNPIRDDKKPIYSNGREFVCLYVGRLEKNQKGVDLLCQIVERTLKKDKSVKFAIVGAGGDGEHLVSDLARKHSDNVKWLGFLSGKKLDDAYRSASLLVFPSRYDTFSIVLLESQGLGMPAVTFDIYGPRDIINRPLRGTRVRPFDVNGFVREVEKYHTLWKNRKKYKELREKIRDSAYADYGKEKVYAELENFLGSVVGSR